MEKKISDHLPLCYNHITPELKEIAEKELFETKEARNKSLKELSILIQNDEKIDFTFTEQELLIILRWKKFNVSRAFDGLKNQIASFRKGDIVYKNLEYPLIKSYCRRELLYVLPKRDQDGCVVLVVFPGKLENIKEDMAPFIQACLLFIYNFLKYPATQITGLKVIADVTGYGLQKVLSTPMWMYGISANIMQYALPLRIKGLHYINLGPFYARIISIFRFFLTQKLKSRIFIHYDLKSLHQVVSPRILPKEFGGQETDEEINNPFEDLEQNHSNVSTYVKKLRGEL